MMTAPHSALDRRRTGTSVVEMTLVAPLLLLLVFGIGEFSIAFTQWQTITNAAREGARVGIVFRGPTCAPATVQAQIQQTVDAYVVASGLTTGAVTTTSTGACTGSGTLSRSGQHPPTCMLPGLAERCPRSLRRQLSDASE
jgi:Flp pilus assembly protein TadG